MAEKTSRIFTNDNCTGCNRCIESCSIPEANVATFENGKNEIHVDDDHCIRCGMCIDACPHDARDYADDTVRFLRDLKKGEKISILIAPAVRTNFPDFPKLLGFLKSLGVDCIYDVSFGADICTWAYIRHLQTTNQKGLISQPCPAVVNCIEKHNPALIDNLAPIQSPAMCAAIYMRRYAGINDKLAFISPCIAKCDEILDENTFGIIQYNVTFWMLMDLIEKNNIDYRTYGEAGFDNNRHNLGSLYPMPGGLKKNVQHFVPGSWVFQIEGQPEVNRFLASYEERSTNGKDLPLLVDILNCDRGCNIGTGAITEDEDALDIDMLMNKEANSLDSLKQESLKAKKREALSERSLIEFDKSLKLHDFKRSYKNKYVKPREITYSELEQAFSELNKKTEEERTVNCCSCGFNTCEEMAIAMARGINHKDNCVEYNKSILKEKTDELEVIMADQNIKSQELQTNVETIFGMVSANADLTGKTNDEADIIGQEIDKINEAAKKLRELVITVNTELQDYKRMGTEIVDISTMSKLLSLNASVEAANAGIYGDGFAVVAEEMQKLSEQTADNARTIIEQNENIFPLLDEVTKMNDELNTQIEAISRSANDIIKSVSAISDAEDQINETASKLVK